MSIESDLVLLLRPICPRVFPDFAAVSTARPYITYQAIGGQVINTLANEVPNRRNVTMQINVWSDTRKESVAIAQQIEDAMRGATAFQAKPNAAPMTDYEADIPVYAAMQDFTIWGYR